MAELVTNVWINAPPDRVWAILTDSDAYPAWNPFIVRLEGKLVEGERLTVRLQPPGITFRPTVIRVHDARELRWRGRLGAPGLFDFEHILEIQAHAHGCRFAQRAHSSGLLVPLLWRSLHPRTRAGFQAMNGALKSRAEAHVIGPDPATPPTPPC